MQLCFLGLDYDSHRLLEPDKLDISTFGLVFHTKSKNLNANQVKASKPLFIETLKQ